MEHRNGEVPDDDETRCGSHVDRGIDGGGALLLQGGLWATTTAVDGGG